MRVLAIALSVIALLLSVGLTAVRVPFHEELVRVAACCIVSATVLAGLSVVWSRRDVEPDVEPGEGDAGRAGDGDRVSSGSGDRAA